jgi:hypothetical protein
LKGVDCLEELPQTPTVDYLVQPAPVVESSSSSFSTESCIVFAVDVSGSMCVSTAVNGKFELRGAKEREDEFKELLAEHKDYQHRLPGYSAVTYVSRLQSVQTAIEKQIREIAKKNPNKRVGLVTFSDSVTLLGDCGEPPLVIAGDHLKNIDYLMEQGPKNVLKRPVHEALEDLITSLWSLREEGGTALGPAMMLAISVSGVTPSSQVVLCTDGLANIGVGSLEEVDSKEFLNFYTEAGEQALLRGVTVDVISIIGSECCLDSLTATTQVTGGMVERVNPQSLLKDKGVMSGVVGRKQLASNVMAMALLHPSLQFQDEAQDEKDRNWMVRDLGNVTPETSCSFTFVFRPEDEFSIKELKEVPIQVQMLFTNAEGMVVLRVTTAKVVLTDDEKEAAAGADLHLIATHAQNRAAKFAKEGNFEEANKEINSANSFLKRQNAQASKDFMGQVSGLNQVIQRGLVGGIESTRDDEAVREIAKARRKEKNK